MLRKKKKQNVRPSSTEGKKRILYLIRDRNGMEKHRRKQAVLFAVKYDWILIKSNHGVIMMIEK